LVVEIAEVTLIQRRVLELVEDGQHVVERSDGRERRSLRRTLQAA